MYKLEVLIVNSNNIGKVSKGTIHLTPKFIILKCLKNLENHFDKNLERYRRNGNCLVVESIEMSRDIDGLVMTDVLTTP